MWTALVLVWVFCSFLSKSQVTSHSSGYSVPNERWSRSVQNSTAREAVARAENGTTERTIVGTPSPVTLTKGTLVADSHSTEVTTETTNRTEAGVTAATAGPTILVASGAPTGPTSSVPTSASQTLPAAATGHPPPSTPHAHVPTSSMLPGTAAVTSAPSTKTVAAARPSTRGPLSTHRPSGPTTGNSTAALTPATSPQAPNTPAQSPTAQLSASWSEVNRTGGSTPILSDATPKPTTLPSVAWVSTTTAGTTKAPTEEPPASTAPAPHSSPAPAAKATSATTQMPSDLTSSTRGPTGPVATQTPGWVGTEATLGTAPAGPTLSNSGDTKVPATDACPLSTQGQYLVVTTEPLVLALVNKGILLAVLLLGVTLFLAILVLFALQAYESYKKKDYTQMDYLINGMYADSEM
ncbi:uncharacterized protein C11orf24 homolog [Trichechus manatus latirostris]|uniref:Uncharacterized protein C11orf24 homolog n=1 Tax=Trichechus manatus latirostris TaxID=127582 RepID=A0A2Y9FZB5_TRIMA|nr:uncharacterized protein C11orf24 homolog [Trichechus manatus latirostris]